MKPDTESSTYENTGHNPHEKPQPTPNEDDDDFVVAIGFDDPKRGYYVEYETIPHPRRHRTPPLTVHQPKRKGTE